MANEISTAGVKVYYGVGVTRPTSYKDGNNNNLYILIPNIKSTPDLNPEPSNLDVTDLSDTEWKRYIPGLKDPGGSLAFTANNTNAFQTAWANLMSAYTGRASGESMWFVIVIPGLTKSFYFSGIPSDLGLKGMEVDAVAEVDCYITPNQISGWAAAPTATPTP